MKTIHIKISGRIPNYMFGILLPEYLEECETAVLYASEDIETVEDLLRLLYQTVLEGGWNGVAEFKENMDMEQFKINCPLLFDFFVQAEGGVLGHFQFYETVFDMSWDGEVNLIEDDADITINFDGVNVVEQQKIVDFLGETEWVDQEEDPKTVKIIKAFWEKHRDDFGIHQEVEEFTTYKAKNGVLQLSEWISPKVLANYQTRERNVTVQHDNIVDIDFYIESKDFDLSKLGFLLFANATDFHDSAADYVGSYLFYDNDIIHPEINIHRDKGFSLDYESGFKSCNFLVQG